MTTFVKLSETNDHEGETWHFYIPVEGNEEGIEELRVTLAHFADEDQYSLDLTPLPEYEVDILVKHSDCGYMHDHNKLEGVLTLPSDFAERMDDDDEDPLYKGEIKAYMKVAENA